MSRPARLLVVGASLGGLDAVESLLRDLGAGPFAVVLVQHRSNDPTGRLAHLLARHTPMEVVEPDSGTELRTGTVYVAPPGYHTLVTPTCIRLSTEGLVCSARPSIDVLFDSAARSWGRRLCALLLTSSSCDGVDGLEAVVAREGRALLQDPREAEANVGLLAARNRLGLPEFPLPHLGDACRGVLMAGRVGQNSTPTLALTESSSKPLSNAVDVSKT